MRLIIKGTKNNLVSFLMSEKKSTIISDYIEQTQVVWLVSPTTGYQLVK